MVSERIAGAWTGQALEMEREFGFSTTLEEIASQAERKQGAYIA